MAQVYDEPIVVRLTVPVGSYPVGTEFGFKDVADAIRALGSSSYFTVVRTQDGDPIPPPTPEDLDEAQKAALARARAARLIRGAEFDPLVPGPGEVIVGSEDGPTSTRVTFMEGTTPSLELHSTASVDAVTSEGPVRIIDGQHDDTAWLIEREATNHLMDPLFVNLPGWSQNNGSITNVTGGMATFTITTGGTTAALTAQSHASAPIPHGAPLVVSARMQAVAGREIRITVRARTAEGSLGPSLGAATADATGAEQLVVWRGTYPESDMNGRVAVTFDLPGHRGTQSGETFTIREPQVEVGTAPTSFVPRRNADGSMASGYTNLGTSNMWGPFKRDASSLSVAHRLPPHLYGRFSETLGRTWTAGVIEGRRIGSHGRLVLTESGFRIETDETLAVEGILGLDRPFTAEERHALAVGPIRGIAIGSPFAGTPVPRFFPPEITLREVDTVTSDDLVTHLSRGGDTIYLRNQAVLKQSRDELATVQTILTAPRKITAVRDLDDGELLYGVIGNSEDGIKPSLYKTRGYDPVAGTVESSEVVHEAISQRVNFASAWGLEAVGPLVIASEYGEKGLDGARHVYLSEDYGETWRMIFDQKETTATIPGAPEWLEDRSHLHTSHYDRYQDRIWVACGDSPTTATYYSDDHGETWHMVVGSDGPNAVQYTGISSFPEGVIFGSDRAPNGVHAWRRASGSEPVVIEPLYLLNDDSRLTHVFSRPFRRWSEDGELLIFAAPVTHGLEGEFVSTLVGMTGLENPVTLAEIPGATGGQPEDVIGVTQGGYIYVTGGGVTYRARAPFIARS